MEPTSGEKRRVLYHAVSSYQLLEAVLHRLRFHPGDPAVLLLPDFIAEKYPKYRRLAERGFFQEVRLFPYLRVPHRSEEEVFAEAARACRKALPCPLGDFSQVYVRGPISTLRCASSRRASPSPFSRTRRGCSPGRGSWRRTWRGATPSTRPSRRNTACSTAAAPWPGRSSA